MSQYIEILLVSLWKWVCSIFCPFGQSRYKHCERVQLVKWYPSLTANQRYVSFTSCLYWHLEGFAKKKKMSRLLIWLLSIKGSFSPFLVCSSKKIFMYSWSLIDKICTEHFIPTPFLALAIPNAEQQKWYRESLRDQL